MALVRNKPFVLIVDDDADTCQVFSATFRSEGFHAVPVMTREDAVAVFSASRPDVILVDICMGEMTLEDFAAHLKRLRPRVPVLVMSAGTPEQIDAARRLLKADSILAKPFDMSVVIAEIRRLTESVLVFQ
jgi:DNA-binding response OmpR family regulator